MMSLRIYLCLSMKGTAMARAPTIILRTACQSGSAIAGAVKNQRLHIDTKTVLDGTKIGNFPCQPTKER